MMSVIEHDRWRIEPSKEGVPLVFGDGKYPQDPPRIASELESSLTVAYAGVVSCVDEIAAEMERAADLDEQDVNRRVTRFDARQWAFALRAAARGR